jgi:hypothetical protein
MEPEELKKLILLQEMLNAQKVPTEGRMIWPEECFEKEATIWREEDSKIQIKE